MVNPIGYLRGLRLCITDLNGTREIINWQAALYERDLAEVTRITAKAWRDLRA